MSTTTISSVIFTDRFSGTGRVVGMEVGLGPRHIVLNGDPAPCPQKGAESPPNAHFYCGQTAGCIKMPLGMEVGLSPGDFVLSRGSMSK